MARPRIADRDARVTFWMSAGMDEQLRRAAAAAGKSVTAYMRDALATVLGGKAAA